MSLSSDSSSITSTVQDDSINEKRAKTNENLINLVIRVCSFIGIYVPLFEKVRKVLNFMSIQ